MATSVVHPTTSSAITQHHSTAGSSQTQKILDHYVEELNPSLASAYNKQSTLWNVAAVATLVVYTALAVSTFIATGVFAPVYIPIAGICALLLLNPVQQFYDRFHEYSNQAAARAEQLTTIAHNYEQLEATSVVGVQRTLYNMGIFWVNIPGMLQHPEHLRTLNPAIARHQFWQGHIAKLEEKKQLVLQEAQQLASDDLPANRERIYQLRAGALEVEKQILESKVKNAFVISAILRPTLRTPLDEMGDFSNLSNQERVIGNAVNDFSLNDLFKFKNNAFAALTVDEVKRSNTTALAQRLLIAAAV